MAQLRAAPRLDISELSRVLQQDETATRALLSHLMEAGLVQHHGSARSREYSLSAAVYRRLGRPADYVRQAAYDEIQQEQMVLQFVDRYGNITRKEAADLCRLDTDSAKRLLQRLAQERKSSETTGNILATTAIKMMASVEETGDSPDHS